MNLRSAIGQMTLVSFPGDSWNPGIEELLRKYLVGGIIHFRENIPESRDDLIVLNKRIRDEALSAPLGLIPFITVDEEGGRVSRLKKIIGAFPTQEELGKKSHEELAANYVSLGSKVAELGFNATWAPVFDINTNPENPVIGDRSFGSDAEEVANKCSIAVRALRSAGLFTSAKHFPGHGDTFIDSHISLPVQDTAIETILERELSPFRRGVEDGIDFIMTAHILFEKVDDKFPVTFSRKFLRDILRDEMRYEGLIITDDLNMGAVKENYPLEERILLSVDAGADVLLLRDSHEGVVKFLETFYALAESGSLKKERIFESAERIRSVKERGL